MIKNLSEKALGVILELLNRIWVEGVLPKSWKEAIVIPIRKPGNDHSIATNYRPIALTSHVCKIVEKLITDRLMYYLEKEKLLSVNQNNERNNGPSSLLRDRY